MRTSWKFHFLLGILFLLSLSSSAHAQMISKFDLPKSGLELERRAQAGSFYDVVGRRAAIAGYENRSLEAWVYPLKILDDFKLSFRLPGYPLEFPGTETMTSINVRPEATTLTYTHAAFTVRQIIFTPVDEAGAIILLEVNSVLPLTITASFRPRVKLMWPAGLMTGNVYWDEEAHAYLIYEETKKYFGMLGSPAAKDSSVMPYQEEPRDVPLQFVINVPIDVAKSQYIPIVIAGGVEGREKVKATYDKLVGNVEALYAKNVAHYKKLQSDTLQLETPDERLNTAFKWAKTGIDKGIATNPLLGTGLIAGFRTSGESERPGFAWFFGRDALWTSLAMTSLGDFQNVRTSLEFLKKFQRADGKIPHEISQSASLIPWFTNYEYPWASADATPLYVIAHADYWRASGDVEFLKTNWDSIVKAYRFSANTDTDSNGLIENTKFGHGWVEGGGLYPPHEEIYMQALWVDASRGLAELALMMNDRKLAEEAKATAERTRNAIEKTYWLENRGYYAFATSRPGGETRKADPGPNREKRQARMDELSKTQIVDEDTVMPSVGLLFRVLENERAQSQIDHLGSHTIATDWGSRILSDDSALYDPLSYHNGSVWPLFTGWSSHGAYAYGRPHVGYQSLMANVQLSYTNALGYVTELLSGDYNTPFGRSSHHQIWSEAMVVTPTVRGLLGIEVLEGGARLRFAPQPPATWDTLVVKNVRCGGSTFDVKWKRSDRRMTTTIERREGTKRPEGARRRLPELNIASAFPLDARVRKATINGREAKFNLRTIGDRQFAEVKISSATSSTEVIFTFDEGTDVYAAPQELMSGAKNQGLRILRSRTTEDGLHLIIEGLGSRSYSLTAYSSRRLVEVEGVKVKGSSSKTQQLNISFEGPPGVYVRREIVLPLKDWN